nr:hypothetical protein [Pantoea agglomerans]
MHPLADQIAFVSANTRKLFMTTVRALPSLPVLSSFCLRMSNQPDAIAAGFQTQLQNQVRLSLAHKVPLHAGQKIAIAATPQRTHIDALLAQLLADRKRVSEAVCHAAEHRESASLPCQLMNKNELALRCDADVYSLIPDVPFVCPPPYPPGSVSPLTPIVIWTAPEIVRFPALITRGGPLRIRSIRLINKAGYRRRGISENDLNDIAPSH